MFCHVNTCHEKDLSFKTQIYKEIELTSHNLALFCYKPCSSSDNVIDSVRIVCNVLM